MAEARTREDPRVTRSRAAVLDAAVQELAEQGFGRLTIDGVAARSGVARSTVYRLWSDKTALVADALSSLHRQPVDQGDSRDDVRAILGHLDTAFNDSPVSDCLPALIDGAARDDAIREMHHAGNDARRARLVRSIRRGVAEGHWDTDPELAAVALAGAVLYVRLMTPRRLEDADLDRLVEVVLGPSRRGDVSPGS